jgi:hypothetical protein
VTRDEPVGRSGTEERTIAEELSGLIRDNLRAFLGWVCLIIVSSIACWLTEGTEYHPLAVGTLVSSSTLFILMALFECLWRLFVDRNA